MGTASLLASTAAPSYLESFLVQRAPLWLNSVWSKYSLEIFFLPGIRDLHPHTFCSNAAGHSTWQRAEIPPEGTGIPTVVSFFFPPVAKYPTRTKSRAILSEYFSQLVPTFITVQDTIPKEFHRAEPILWLFCLKHPAMEVNGVDLFSKVASTCCSH